jgi:hypothetical protein
MVDKIRFSFSINAKVRTFFEDIAGESFQSFSSYVSLDDVSKMPGCGVSLEKDH